MKYGNSRMLFSLTLVLPLALSAVTNYPSSGGDIATAEGWGLEEVPSGVVGFTLGVPYSASQAVTFAGMQLSGSSGDSSVFDLSSGSVTLNGNTDTDLQFSSSGLTAVINGGSLTVGKGSRIGYTSSTVGNTLVFDGCTFAHTGSKLMVGASESSGNAVVLTNNASASLGVLEISNNGGHGNRFEINAGCTVTTGNVMSDSYGTRRTTDDSLLLIRGTGASLATSSSKYMYIGYRHDNNVVTVADGGSLSIPSGTLQFGVASGTGGASHCANGWLNVLNGATVSTYNLTMGINSHENTTFVSNATLNVGYATLLGSTGGTGTNRLVATGSSTTVVTTRLRLGMETGNDCNEVVVSDGAKLTAMSDFVVGSATQFNEVVASNATLQVQSFVIGKYAAASNNAVRITGPSAVLTQTKNSWGQTDAIGYFGQGANGLLELSDRCVVTSPHPAPVIGNLSNGNVLRITGGAQATGSNPCVGHAATASTDATTGNRLEILDGAKYTVVRPYVKGVGNGIVVSNATLYSNNTQTNTVIIGYVASGDLVGATSNNYLRLEGSSPDVRLFSTGGYCIWNGSRVEFVLPPEPYDKAPLCGSQLHVDASSDIVVDLSAVDATSHGKLRYPLFEVSVNNDSLRSMLNADALRRANARLAGKAVIAWEGSGIGSTLVCTVKGNKGMMLLFR